jgi:tetratricopeptide (TPR) repeat protein
MAANETEKLGQMVVDHFARQPHNPWDRAETLEDVAPALDVVRVLVRMGRYKAALDAFREVRGALYYNLGVKAEIQALLKPFFPDGWDKEPVKLDESDLNNLVGEAVLFLSDSYPEQAKKLCERRIVRAIAGSAELRNLNAYLQHLGIMAWRALKLAEAARLLSLASEIAEARAEDDQIFSSKLSFFLFSADLGDREAADRLWHELDGMPLPQNRAIYRFGTLECFRAIDLFYRGELTEDVLARAQTSARNGRNRYAIENLNFLRGEWCLAQREPALAVESFAEGVRMSSQVGDEVTSFEVPLALARLRAGMDFDIQREAERLSRAVSVSDTIHIRSKARAELALGELWHALGEHDSAVEHSLRAHSMATADGEPYVWRYYLDRTRALLAELGATLPEEPRYDPSTTPSYPWEKDVRAVIERLRAERLRAEQDSGKKDP